MRIKILRKSRKRSTECLHTIEYISLIKINTIPKSNQNPIPDEIIVAVAALLDEQLRVEQHEATEEKQAAVQRDVEEEVHSDKEINEPEHQEQRETAREYS